LKDREEAALAVPPLPWDRGSALRRMRLALRHLRVVSRAHLGRVLAARLTPRALSTADLASAQIASVLICRINARMGNALFLTPLIRELHARLPHAAIDVAVAYPQAENLLGQLPGVRRVIGFPYKGVHLVWRYVLAVARVRARRYDLAIDPMPNSTSARLILMACRARFRLGFASEHQWVPLTHAVPEGEMPLHRALQPVYLLQRALGVTPEPGAVRLASAIDASERAHAQSLLAGARALAGADTDGARTIGFFAHATGPKALDRGFWLAFWRAFLALDPQVAPLEILPTADSAPTEPRFATLHVRTPRRLAAVMAEMQMFISADTGPMHLASSTPVPTVALFRASEPALYGPLKPSDLALEAGGHSPTELAQRVYQHWLQCRTLQPAA